ncbi:mycothiol transferase [Streptomyces sp. NPDC055254]
MRGPEPRTTAPPGRPPSSLTLLGLLRHLTEVERGRLRTASHGQDARGHHPRDEAGRRSEFDVQDADPAHAPALWEDARARSRSRAAVEAAGSLDTRGRPTDHAYSPRHILTHMIEEHARHNGPADLLREAIDATTGE